MTSELITKIPAWERQADDYERKALALRQMVAAVRALNGEAGALLSRKSFEAHRTTFEIAPPAEDGIRGPRAVLRIMAEDPRRAWKVVELKREMLRRGWAPSPKAVEASVKRLRHTGEVVATSYGWYKLARPVDAESAETDDAIGEAVR
jgi:DNA-binding response OmpR family regulator